MSRKTVGATVAARSPKAVGDRMVPQDKDAGLRPAQRPDSYYRNLYAEEPSFHLLGKRDAEFGAFLKSNGQLDFSDPKAVMQLTKALLRVDFGLEIDLPDDRLCPPVPNRHNYIMWLKGLMDSTSYTNPGGKHSGLDIGTGASCIYPLLGAVQRPWYFIGTDIDSKNIIYARKNVELNGLEDRIRIVERKASDPLIPLDHLGLGSIDFVMTNPPFYLSEEDMDSSAKKKARPPHSACTGAPVEMVCKGGELAFVGRILAESLILRDRVRWYTSMFGKASSLESFVESLRQNGIDNYAVTEFVQGNKTRRWAVGWSFGAMRPPQETARGMSAGVWKNLLPPVVEVELYKSPSRQGVRQLADRIAEIISPLDLVSWEWDPQKLSGIGRARENVWSRAWRRKKLREAKEGPVEETSARNAQQPEACAFGFLITVGVGTSEIITTVRWVEGHDYGLFESFSGYIKDHLTGRKRQRQNDE